MDYISIELRHLIRSSERLRLVKHLIRSSESFRLVTLGVYRHLDAVEASWPGDLLKEGCEKTQAVVSGLVLAISGVEVEQPRVD